MYPKKHAQALLLAVALVAAGSLVSCSVDDKYDFNDDIDLTIGLGGGELVLPTSSTSEIKLSDILKLHDGDCIRMEADGSYLFEQDPEEVAAAHPKVDKVVINTSKENIHTFSIELPIPDVSPAAVGKRRAALQNIPVELAKTKIFDFNFQGDLPKEVVDLKDADIENQLNLEISFPNAVKAFLPTVKELRLTLPSFIGYTYKSSNGSISKDGNTLVINDVKTAQPLKVELDLNSLSFTETSNENGSLKINGRKIDLQGTIHIALSAVLGEIDVTQLAQLRGDKTLSSSLDISNFVISGATGRFNPEINLGDLGSVQITSVPSFLKEKDVVIDLDNPQIMLTLSNDMDIESTATGTLTAVKDGSTLAKVNVSGINIRANNTTRACICRHKPANAEQDVDYVEVPNLSTLIETIPDEITFSADVSVNSARESHVDFGRWYNVRPSYSIKAPVAFAEKADIIYTDSDDGWNGDLEDMELSSGASVELTADVENRLPAYCEVEIIPIDVNGNAISSSLLAVDVPTEVAASPDGVKPTVSALRASVKQMADNALKKLDGVQIRLHVKAKGREGNSVTGITLNGETQTLVLKNISIKIVGGVNLDLN